MLNETKRRGTGMSIIFAGITTCFALILLIVTTGRTQNPSPQGAANAAAQAAFNKDLTAANAGDVQAQLRVGKAYYDARHMDRNFTEAARWFRQASQNGSAEANAWLVQCYLEGRGVPQDKSFALALTQKAADAHDPTGLRFLGVMNENGDGVPVNFFRAADLFSQGAALNDAGSIDHMGKLYQRGMGVVRNPEKARSLFEQAAALGDSWGQLHLAEMVLDGKSNKPAGPNEAKAKKLLEDSSDQGNRVAAFRLGMMYFHGRGVPKSDAKAVQYFRKSAARGFAFAQRLMGVAFETGRGVPTNLVHAYVWYSVADRQGDSISSRLLEHVKPKMTAAEIQQAQAVVDKWNTKIEQTD